MQNCYKYYLFTKLYENIYNYLLIVVIISENISTNQGTLTYYYNFCDGIEPARSLMPSVELSVRISTTVRREELNMTWTDHAMR